MKITFSIIFLLLLSSSNKPQSPDTLKVVKPIVVNTIEVDTSMYNLPTHSALQKEAVEMRKLKDKANDVYHETLEIKEVLEREKQVQEIKTWRQTIYRIKNSPE